MRLKWIAFTVSCLVLILPIVSRAQGNPQAISYGQTLEGSLATPVLDAQYAFNAQQGDMITILMQAVDGNLDPFLILLDGAQTNVLAVDNDGGGTGANGQTDARVRFVIPAAGVYVIKAAASPAQTEANGNYRLTLTLDNPTPTPSAAADAPIVAAFERDRDFAGDLSDATPFHIYRVQAAEADTLNITIATTGDVSAGMYLYNADFSNRLAIAELGQRLDVTFPSAGAYFLVVGRVGMTGSGGYTIRSEQPDTVTSIRAGMTMRDMISAEQPVKTYSLQDFQAGTAYSIRVTVLSGDLIPYLYIVSTDSGAKVTEAISQSGVADLSFELPDSGAYALVVTREGQADGTTTGEFALSVSNGDVQTTPTLSGAELGILLVAGQVQTVDLTSKIAELYRFDARKNTTAQLDVVAGGEVFTVLADAQFKQIAASTGSLRETALGDAGAYYVLVMRRYGPNDPNGGQLTLTLQGGIQPATVAATRVPLILKIGQSVRGQITAEEYSISYKLSAKASEIVQVRMAADGSSLDPSLSLLDAAGNLLIFNDDAAPGITDALFVYEFSADGDYTIIATRSGEANGTTRGAYILTASIPGSEATPTPEAGQGSTSSNDNDTTGVISISYGSRETGVIDAAKVLYYYTFEGNAGDVIDIQMGSDGSGDLDPMLYLYYYGADNVPVAVAANDNQAEGTLNAAITGYALPQTGRYVIIATRAGTASGTTSGGFILVLSMER
ncbi:MAG: PPC domain-containing protein [Anaerolineae bacterium]|nr:PPC domain-containing protein [Anaerolineae bacterium]